MPPEKFRWQFGNSNSCVNSIYCVHHLCKGRAFHTWCHLILREYPWSQCSYYLHLPEEGTEAQRSYFPMLTWPVSGRARIQLEEGQFQRSSSVLAMHSFPGELGLGGDQWDVSICKREGHWARRMIEAAPNRGNGKTIKATWSWGNRLMHNLAWLEPCLDLGTKGTPVLDGGWRHARYHPSPILKRGKWEGWEVTHPVG